MEDPAMKTTYTPYSELEREQTGRAADRGKARDLRDQLIAGVDSSEDVETITSLPLIDTSEERLARILDTYDWFELGQRAGDRGTISITEAGHRSLREDEYRSYREIAGEGASPTEVRAGD